MSLGPESTTALMTAAALGPLAAGNPVRCAALAASLALLMGLICVVAWLARLGFLADLLSRPVLVGYLAGLALLMVASQLGKVTGVAVHGGTFAAQLTSFARHAGAVQGVSLLVAACVVAFLFALRSRWPHVPGPLAAVLLATAAAVGFALRRHGVALVGNIPAGLPAVKAPALQARAFRELALPALSVVVVAFSDIVLTGRSFARRRESIDANQEFLALGVANVGASFVHGFPVSSSASRTAIARSTGARTQVYSLAALATVLIVLLAGRPVLARFPQPALGAIVIYAATQLIDISAFRRLAAFRRREFALALAAAAGVWQPGSSTGCCWRSACPSLSC